MEELAGTLSAWGLEGGSTDALVESSRVPRVHAVYLAAERCASLPKSQMQMTKSRTE